MEFPGTRAIPMRPSSITIPPVAACALRLKSGFTVLTA
jgi:hypothetical protein